MSVGDNHDDGDGGGDDDRDSGGQNKSQLTKSQMMIWYFVRLIKIIFIRNSDDIRSES